MVRVLAFFLLFSSCAFASQMDPFSGPAEPAYVKAVAPRFTKWIFENFENVPSSGRKVWKELLQQESSQLQEWSFQPFEDFSWPRLQYGMRFNKGANSSAYIFLLPQDSQAVLSKIQKFFLVPKNLQKNFLGFGISLQNDEIYFVNKETDHDIIKRMKVLAPDILGSGMIKVTSFSKGKWQKSRYLALIKNPKEPVLAFRSLVSSWKAWFDSDGGFLQYELTFDKFNLRILDGAAIGTARKINNEFLLNNLRLSYKSSEDYDILYP